MSAQNAGTPLSAGIVTFPGSPDDTDASRAMTCAGAVPVPRWHADRDLREVEAVIRS